MSSRRLTLFDLFGIEIRVHISWLVLAGLIVWSLAAGYFPYTRPGLPPATYAAMAVVGLAGLAVSIVSHELAHALVARRFQIPIAGITLFVFGGVAEMTGEPASPKGEFLMAAAGPAFSAALGLVLSGGCDLAVQLGADSDSPFMAVASYLSLLNLLLAAFNMVPAFPLDGGRMLRAGLWAWRKDVLWATRIAAALGALYGVALMSWGIYAALVGNPVSGVWWIVIGLFVRSAALQSYRREMLRRT